MHVHVSVYCNLSAKGCARMHDYNVVKGCDKYNHARSLLINILRNSMAM